MKVEAPSDHNLRPLASRGATEADGCIASVGCEIAHRRWFLEYDGRPGVLDRAPPRGGRLSPDRSAQVLVALVQARQPRRLLAPRDFLTEVLVALEPAVEVACYDVRRMREIAGHQ